MDVLPWYHLGILSTEGAEPCSSLRGRQSVSSELCQRVSKLPTSSKSLASNVLGG